MIEFEPGYVKLLTHGKLIPTLLLHVDINLSDPDTVLTEYCRQVYTHGGVIVDVFDLW